MPTLPAYYNEIDPGAAAWLRELIAEELIAPGDVDERSIVDVQPDDLRGYAQCHFFAGIGGWSLALRLAGWPDARPVWTGSCPCQPLSSAGRRQGHADERHLWPAFHALIAERRPSAVFGEQVASVDGREWLAAVRADLEHLGYAVGAADLPAAGVGAPHIRQRLFWVADAATGGRPDTGPVRDAAGSAGAERDGRACLLADASSPRLEVVGQQHARAERPAAERGGATGRLDHADGAGRDARQAATAPDGHGRAAGPDGCAGLWTDAVWLPCRDGKARPTQPGLQPLAHGVPGRVGLLRGYGNAIVPQVAAQFVAAYREAVTATTIAAE